MLFLALLFLGNLFFSISGLKAFDNVFCKKVNPLYVVPAAIAFCPAWFLLR